MIVHLHNMSAAVIEITIGYPWQTNETLRQAPCKKGLEGKSARNESL